MVSTASARTLLLSIQRHARDSLDISYGTKIVGNRLLGFGPRGVLSEVLRNRDRCCTASECNHSSRNSLREVLSASALTS